MSYLTEYIAATLKAARETKGFSQRDLSKRTGVPQSHISNIENGAVDLRLSSLIELARVLGLELMLLPRKTVPAVRSIVRQGAQSTPAAGKAEQQARKELNRLQNALNNLPTNLLTDSELTEYRRQLRELEHFRLTDLATNALRDTHRALKDFAQRPDNTSALRNSFVNLRTVRNALAQGVSNKESDAVRPAYSLDEDDDG